jgi:O-antigen/teichoic acid export membrane protein
MLPTSITHATLKSSRSFRTIVLASGQIMTSLGQVLILAILARLLSKEEFAVYVQCLLIATTMLPILSLGLPSTLYVLFPAHDQHSRNLLIANQMLLLASGFLFVVVLGNGGSAFVAEIFNNPQLHTALLWVAPYILFSLPILSLETVLLVHHKTMHIALFNTATQCWFLICTIVPALIWQQATMTLLGLSLARTTSYVFALVLMLRTWATGDGKPAWQLIQAQMVLGIPLLLATSFGSIQTHLDKWIVSLLDSPEQFIIFAVGATELPVIRLFTRSIIQVLMADCSRLFQQNRLQEIARILWKATYSNTVFLIPTMIYLLVVADAVIPLVFSEKYMESVAPFMLYLFIIPVRLVNFSGIHVASGKGYFLTLVTAINLVLKVGLTLAWYPATGFMGVIYANLLVSYLVSWPLQMVILVRVYRLPMGSTLPKADFVKALLAIGLATMVLMVKPFMPDHDLLVVIGCGLLYGGALIVAFVLLRVQVPLIQSLQVLWKGKYSV